MCSQACLGDIRAGIEDVASIFAKQKSATCTETVSFDSVIAVLLGAQTDLEPKQLDEMVEDRLVMFTFRNFRFEEFVYLHRVMADDRNEEVGGHKPLCFDGE